MIPDRFVRDQQSADALVEGCFLIDRSRAERVSIPVKIEFAPPRDPVTDEVLDRAPRWQVWVGGVLVDDEPLDICGFVISALSDFYPQCRSRPISLAEHDYLVARADWSAAFDPFDPFGSPNGRIDPMTASLPTMGVQ